MRPQGPIALVFVLLSALFVGMPAMASNHEKAIGEALVSVTVPELSMPEQIGKALFEENCASCHGKDAAGQKDVAPPLIHKIYEPSHHGDISFLLAAKQGVRAHHWPFGDMPPVPEVSDAEVKRITQYIRAVQRANGIF